MNIFTFNQVYNVVRAQTAAYSTEKETNMYSDWRDFYPNDEEIDDLIDQLPKNNTFEQDIKKAASLLQDDFDDLHDDNYEDINELNEAHKAIEDKLPKFLYHYIK